MTKLATFVLIVFCALIVSSDARFRVGGSRFGGSSRSSSSSSRGYGSKPKPSHTFGSSSSRSKPWHTSSGTSHGNIGGWTTSGLSTGTQSRPFGSGHHVSGSGTQSRPFGAGNQIFNTNPHSNSEYSGAAKNSVIRPPHYTPPTQRQSHVGGVNAGSRPPYPTQHQTQQIASAPGHHAPSAPYLPSAPPASHVGWIVPKNTGGSSSSASGHGMNQNSHSGYGTSVHSNRGWSQPSQTATANKNWPTSSPAQSNPHNYGGVGNANYPRQQYHPTQTNSFGTSYHPQPNQPHVVNNFITNNHQTHYANPGFSSFSTPSVGYHVATYHSYPTFYSPYPSYSSVNSFGLGLALGSSLGHHHYSHDYYGYPSSTHHYYHHHYSNNNNGNGNNNNVNGNSNTANGNNPNSNTNENTNPNNFNGNSNQNMQPNQNRTFQDPRQPMAPLVYSISGQTSSDDDDSTEIIFTNPYLIVGFENMLMYGEFQDEKDILIIIEQEADGLDPYPWDPMYALWYPNVTSINEHFSNLTSVEQTTIISTTMTTKDNTIPTTTIKTDIQSNAMPISTNTDTAPVIPLAPLPAQ